MFPVGPKCSAVGAKQDSPALQRWVTCEKDPESRRDDTVPTHIFLAMSRKLPRRPEPRLYLLCAADAIVASPTLKLPIYALRRSCVLHSDPSPSPRNSSVRATAEVACSTCVSGG